MVNEVKFTLAMDGGTAVITDLDGVGKKLIDLNTKLKDAGGGAQAFGGSMQTVGNQLKGFDGSLNSAKGSVDSLAHGLKSAFIGSSVAVGLIGLKNTMIDFTQSMVQAQIQVDQLRNGLNFAVGRNQAAGELNFIRESSKALGLEFVSTSQQYMKLAASAHGTSLEGQKVRDIFTAVAQASTVMGLSADQTSGALLSISQMISKNTVMSEELKGQLGERLPGAFQIAASAMGVTTAQLNKMLETGQVLAEDFLPKFADELTRRTAPEVEEASKSMQASVNRLSNSWTDLKQVTAQSGIGAQFAKDMRIISDAVQSTATEMRVAKAEGAGFFGQLGVLAGGVLTFLNPMNAFNYQVQDLSAQLVNAQNELAKTTLALEKDPESIWWKKNLAMTRDYINLLGEALSKQNQLIGTYESGDERKIKAFNAEMAQAKAVKDKAAGGYSDVLQSISGVNANFQKHLSQLKAGFDAGIVTQEKYVEDVKALIDKEGGVRKEAAKAHSDVGNTIAANIARANETALLELEIGGKANASDRFRITTLNQLSEELRKKNITLSRAIELESQMHDAEMNMASAEAALRAIKEAADAEKAKERNIAALLDVGQKEIDQIDEKIRKQAEANEQIGLTKAQVFDLNAARQMQSALADEEYSQAIRNAAVYAGEYRDAYLQYADSLELAAKKRRELAGLDAVSATKKAADEARKEWEKTAEKINESITDALMRGFESGKGFAENLRDTVENMFKTLVLRPTVSAIVNPVAQGVTGLLGLPGAANAAGAVNGASNLAAMGGLAGSASAFGGAFSAGAAVGTEAFSAGVAMMTEATGATSFMAGAGQALGAIGPVGWAALAALAVLSLQDHGTPTRGTGEASATFDRFGQRVGETTIDAWGGLSRTADKAIVDLQKSYAAAAKALGAGMVDTTFAFGSNTGKDSQGNNFALGVRAGASSYSTGGEQAYSDAAFSLAASRAVFAALQGSDLPQYLARVFDGLTAGELTQDQITNTLAYAQSLKSVRDALLETREPLQILKDNVADGIAALGTSADTFKRDFVAAIDAGITPDKLAQWQGLQNAMDQLAQASGNATEAVKDVGRSIADIANERARLQDQLDELTMTSAQLLEKQRNAIDDSNKSLFDQVQAQIQLKDAAQAAAEAATAAAEAERAAASQRLSAVSGGASDALSALNRAVAAQRAIEAAQLAAQKEAAAAIYKAQSSALQSSMASAKTSLDAVTSSVGKLKNLSASLRSTLDGMRIAGSDGAYRSDAQAQIRAALDRARSGGGLPLDGQLASALATVSKPSEDLYATFEDYARDFYRTANDIKSLDELTGAQLSADEVTQRILQDQNDLLSAQQRTLQDGFDDQVSGLDAILANAQQQLDAANGLNTSILSMADALDQFNAAVLRLANERAAQGLPTTPGVAEGRATAIRDYITSASATFSGTELANTIANQAKVMGVSESEIAAAIGWENSKVRAFFAGAGIQKFDVGTNYVPRDMLAQIHQGEAIVPRAYNPAAGGNSGNAELIAEIRALREEVRQLQQSSSTTAAATRKTADMLDTATEGGRAMLTEAYA